MKKRNILLYLSTIISKIIQFITIPLFSTWLSVSDYGKFDLYTTLVTLLVPLVSFSVEEAVFRLSFEEKEIEKRIYISSGLAIYCTSTFIMFICCTILFWLSNNVDIFLFLLFFTGVLFFQYTLGCLRTLKKLTYYAVINVVMSCLVASGAVLCVYILKMQLQGMLLGYGIGYLICVYVLIRYLFKLKLLKFSLINLTYIKRLIIYSFPLIFNSVSWWIINVSDRFIIRQFMGTEYNGIYAIASKVPALCATFFSVFSVIWQEESIEILGDVNKEKKYNNMFNRIICSIIPLCAFIVSCNYILFHWIFDIRYIEARSVSLILVTASIFQLMSNFFGGIQVSLKNSKENGRSTIYGALINFLINIILVQWLGIFAAAISTLISYLVVCVIRYYGSKHIFKIKVYKKTALYVMMYVLILALTQGIENLEVCIIEIIICILWMIWENKLLFKIFFEKNKTIYENKPKISHNRN